MKIAVACKGDPTLFSTWSGIPVSIIEHLRKRSHEVVPITLISPKEPWSYNWKRRINHRLYNRWFLSAVQKFYLQKIGGQLDRQVAEIRPDVVIVIHGDFLAYTSFTQPAYFIHDTTFEGLVNYYAEFTNLTKRSVHLGDKMYKLALNRAKAAIFSSGWASKSAISYYGTHISKVFTIPLGANLNSVPEHQEIMKYLDSRSRSNICYFLFLGVDWQRKGGPDALRFVIELNRLGIESRLQIAGCMPSIPLEMRSYVELYGFLRKDVPEQKVLLNSLFINATALILLSVAECYGCVYCEANAFGLPALGRDTGGVPEIIKDGVNGLLFSKFETPEDLALRWKVIWENRENYKQLSLNSRKEYMERLNYDVFTVKLEEIIMGAVAN